MCVYMGTAENKSVLGTGYLCVCERVCTPLVTVKKMSQFQG